MKCKNFSGLISSEKIVNNLESNPNEKFLQNYQQKTDFIIEI